MGKIRRTFGFILNHPFGKRHPIQSLYRFITWQIQSTLQPGRLFVKKFIGPVKFYARKGLTGITGNIYTGLHEFNDMAFLLHFLRPEDTFFDVGANVGSYTLLASGYCGAKTIAFEPADTTFELLSKNVELNRLSGVVTPVNAAVGASEGTIAFTSGEDTTNHAVAEGELPQNKVIHIQVVTVDKMAHSAVPALMKIDVEGYETEVLKGMTHVLDNPALKAIIIELNGSGERYGYNEKDIHELLLTKQFKPYQYDPFNRVLTALSSFGHYNTIYCRDPDFVNSRVKQAAAVKIMGDAM
ncbi:MAG TPA: FkbM family methyltransferase [Mucilaginibacter sp.]|nr:FkbM family methyltransferase [Mucilaginibacter sp.]